LLFSSSSEVKSGKTETVRLLLERHGHGGRNAAAAAADDDDGGGGGM
jgi:hypothetical protein